MARPSSVPLPLLLSLLEQVYYYLDYLHRVDRNFAHQFERVARLGIVAVRDYANFNSLALNIELFLAYPNPWRCHRQWLLNQRSPLAYKPALQS